MPRYSYEARDAYGRPALGELDAPSPAALRDQLTELGFHLTALRAQPAAVTAGAAATGAPTVYPPATPGMAPPNPAPGSPAGPPPNGYAGAPPASSNSSTVVRGFAAGSAGTGPRLSLRAQTTLFREWASTFRAGMTAFQACDAIGGRFRSGPTAQLVSWVRSQASSGVSFADALATAPVRVDESTVGIVRAGERGGFLPYVLEDLANAFERQYYLNNRMTLPKILYIYLLWPALFFAWPLPAFIARLEMADFNSTGGAPPVAQAMQAYTRVLLHQAVPIAIFLALVIFGWKAWVGTPSGLVFADALALKLPFWGKMQRSLNLSRFLRILSNLYRGAVPLRESWSLAASSAPNSVIRSKLLAQEQLIAANAPFSTALKSSGLFDEGAVGMIATGEQTGEVDAMLLRLAGFEEEQLDRMAKAVPWVAHITLAMLMTPPVVYVLARFFLAYYQTMFKALEI